MLPGQSTWDLQWSEWYCDKFFAESLVYLLSTAALYSHMGGADFGPLNIQFHRDVVSSHCNSCNNKMFMTVLLLIIYMEQAVKQFGKKFLLALKLFEHISYFVFCKHVVCRGLEFCILVIL